MLTAKNNFLTVNGWKNITELSVGDEVMTTNFAGHGIFSPILNITEYDYDGFIYEHVDKLKRRGGMVSHFSLTEDSVIPIRKSIKRDSVLTGERIKIDQIDTIRLTDFMNKGGYVQAVIKSPLQYSMNDKRRSVGLIKNGSVDMSEPEYFRLLAHAIMRASIQREGSASGTITAFSVRKNDDPTILMDLLDRYDIPYRISVDEAGRHIVLRSSAGAARALKKYIKSYQSRRTVPKTIMTSTSPDAVMAFLTEIIRIKKGHGNIPSKGEPLTFSVSNMPMAEQLADLFFKVGYATTIESQGIMIHLVINRAKFARISVEDVAKRKYKGKVYSVDVINEMAVCNPTNLGPRYSMVVKVN